MAPGNNSFTSVTNVGILLIGFVIIQRLGNISCEEGDKVCSSKSTCSECITSGPQCVWCKAQNYTANHRERCESLDNMINVCPPDDVINPHNEFAHNRNEHPDQHKADVENIVQLWPQEVTLKIRTNSPSRFQVQFKQAKDYPVDLYFLMDLSNSMRKHKDKLAALGSLLGSTMENITRNFRLGFGSYIDKTVSPYVNIHPEFLKNPCGKAAQCAPPYGFINHMSLEKNVARFVNEVSRSQTSGNLDEPEGLLDAMMQAIVCNRDIGWRNVSRKILLVATDNIFHVAGDGKLGGIMTPNDKSCHLDTNGIYTESNTMDYPSIAQLNSKVMDNNVNVIFAIVHKIYHVYERLQTGIVGSYIGELKDDSDNIIDIVKDQYEQIRSVVELKDNAPSNVHVSYYSNCLNDSSPSEQTNVCKQLEVGEQVKFDVEVQVDQCPVNVNERKIRFEISPVGLSDTLVVNLDLICECDCESAQQQELNSESCSSVGTYQCGVCSCPSHKSGPFCQCDYNGVANLTEEALCTKDSSSAICSGRGSCICGQCHCFEPSIPGRRIYGQHCECDDYNCLYSNGRVCGGPDRGTCDCGQCKCLAGWSGVACDCETSDESCTDGSGNICGNNGNCSCGKCECGHEYMGEFCEQSKGQSLVGKCDNYKWCAHCFAFPDQSQKLKCDNCPLDFQLVNEAKAETLNEHRCVFKDDDGCLFYIVYVNSFNGHNLTSPIRVQEKKECPEPVNVLMILAIVIGAILLIGLALLLLWKIITTIYDKREYAKFKRELEDAKWEKMANPLYKPSTSNFTNPTYNTNHLD